MDLKTFFDCKLSPLRMVRGHHDLEGIRGYLAQELHNAGIHTLPAATELADEYLTGILLQEASAIYTRSIP